MNIREWSEEERDVSIEQESKSEVGGREGTSKGMGRNSEYASEFDLNETSL